MIATMIRWQELARMWVGHWISRPFHYAFDLLPGFELGLESAQTSFISCTHPALAGRRAVQLSDLHLDRYLPRHDAILQMVSSLQPDWIFITGDLLNVQHGLPPLFRFLSSLGETAPVYITLGNHDHYSGVAIDEFNAWAARHKITLLINQTTFVPLESGELAIAGVDDPSLHRADLRCIPRRRSDRFTLLLAHSPNILEQLNGEHEVDLILCGHSHAGQWRVPFVRPFWLPPGCNGRLHGLYEQNGHRLYVNRGLGWSVVPLRWNCPPEVVVIDWVYQPEGSPFPPLP